MVADLAIFGGRPAFTEPLYVGRPNLGDRERFLARVNDILDRRYFTNGGPYEVAFERRIAELAGVSHCVAVANATIGLEIAIRATGLSGEVIVPSFTFVATAHALQWQQITPIFCDIDPHTYTLDPDRVEELITPRTSGIIGVHLWGRSCDIDGLSALARRYGLKLLFDAAHALACSHRGVMIGSFGDAEVFSFHATKFINSFEGGAIVTNSDELAHRARLMRNFGFVGYDEVDHIGINGKMTEISAAMGLTSLESLDEIVAANRRNHYAYARGLRDVPGITLVTYDEAERCNYQYAVILVDPRAAGLERDQIYRLLHAENVVARRYFHPGCHRLEPYRSSQPSAGQRLPVTERVSGEVLALPTGSTVREEDVDRVCSVLRMAVQESARVREWWRQATLPEAADPAVAHVI
ncbi:aminotransferase class I/II-fold pyridoxal phosphate-dependent enzyme [soil metagenome]